MFPICACLWLPSARRCAPPFMVMDVMAAAARIEAAGGRVIHMEVGQPAAPAPQAGDRGGARRARSRAARLHLGARHPLAARAHRAALSRNLWRAGRCRARSSSPPARRRASFWRFWRCSSRAIGSRSPMPGYPPYRHILTALGCEPVLIETDAATRHAITGEACCAAHRKDAAHGRAGRKPGQSRPAP